MIDIVCGDITTLEIEAIVCPAHKHFIRGQGVSAAVFDRAGTALVLACSNLGKGAVGETRLTAGFGLPASYILHTITPMWTGGDQWGANALQQLSFCYQQVLALAENHHIRELAFPAMGAGSNKIPHALAAHLALKELKRRAHYFQRIVVCLYDQATHQFWLGAWEDLQASEACR